MRTFRLIVAYDGTEFHGWQVQPAQRTVQGVLEEALDRLPMTDRSRLSGAGRTDAGVHARGQVASFTAETALPARALAPLLARELPDDVRIEDAAEVDAGFHARHSARARRYAYRLLWRGDALWSRFAWRPERMPHADALVLATRELEGEHDCSAFQATGSSPAKPICRIARASWSPWEGGLRLDVIADHFLYHMVRNIVGTALAAASAQDPAAAMRRVLASRDRRAGGATAPAQGLTLEQVFYGREAGA